MLFAEAPRAVADDDEAIVLRVIPYRRLRRDESIPSGAAAVFTQRIEQGPKSETASEPSFHLRVSRFRTGTERIH